MFALFSNSVILVLLYCSLDVLCCLIVLLEEKQGHLLIQPVFLAETQGGLKNIQNHTISV